MTNQEIIDLAAQFDLITFGPQDLVYFAREIEAKTIARCAKVCEEYRSADGDGQHVAWYVAIDGCVSAIRALGDDDE